MSSPSFVLSEDGTRIAFSRTGGGPALILVEPAGHYRDLTAFDGLVPLLATSFTVYTYDRRGRGQSGDTLPFNPGREVEDLAALVRQAGGSAFAYGHSSGALLALYAAANRVPIAGLVLLEPPLNTENPGQPDPLTGQLAALIKAGKKAEAVEHFHSAIGVPEEMIGGMRGTDRWDRMVGIAHTLVYDCLLSEAITPAVCSQVKMPTLVLDSEGSTDDLTGWAATAARLIPHARHESLPGEWHTVAPDLIATEIKEFVGTIAAFR